MGSALVEGSPRGLWRIATGSFLKVLTDVSLKPEPVPWFGVGLRNVFPAEVRSSGMFFRQRSAMQRDESGRPELNQIEARQGFLDRPVLVILAVALLLVVVGFMAVAQLV